ncbi:hypothetical protein ACFL5U_02930 [Candidatus Margulisiibacteriota bacterium]
MSLKHVITLLIIIICLAIPSFGEGQAQGYEEAIYTDEFGLGFYPSYPPTVGEEVVLGLRTFYAAQKVTIYTDRDKKIPMTYQYGRWLGQFNIPDDYKEGGHFFTVWIRYVPNSGAERHLTKNIVWYQTAKKKTWTPLPPIPLPPGISAEAEESLPMPVTGEAVEVTRASTLETGALQIKGSQTITFKSRSLVGSKEGYAPGTTQTREETLRINVAGRAADTDIEASLYRTSATGVTQVGEREEDISILLRRGSTEAYLGDFTADLTETEFAKLDKVLSGARLKGEYGNWGFNALYSSPKGEAKSTRRYGDNTQGPYQLGSSPVVIDSERVYVDGSRQKRGDDYTVDYQAGTVSFIRKTIDAKSVLQIYYDYRQTLYSHATYGLRAFYKPLANLKIGATYLDDSDALSGAAAIRQSTTGEATNPQSHYVIGADADYVSENISAAGEVAYSLKNFDILTSNSTKETGRAGKFSLSSSLGPVGVTGHAKKVGANFRPIADPDPKQDIWEYGAGLSYRSGALFGTKGNYEYQKYTQSSVVYANLYKTAKVQLTPDNYPSLEYNYSETDESNDPVSGSQIRRVITKNSVETIYRLGFVSSSLKGTVEKWLRRSPSEEVTNYRKINLGVATVGIDKVTLSSNVELENRQEPSGLVPYRRTFDFNFSATPAKQFFLSSSLNVIDDSVQGRSDIMDLSYRAQPAKQFKTDGKYTISSVVEEFPTASEAVSKQTGSISFDYRPLRQLRLRYLYKPNFTRIARTQGLSYNNEQQQTEINIIPVRQALVGWVYKKGASFNIYKSDYPNYSAKENTEDTNSTLYTLKMAPWQILSTEFNYLQDDAVSTTLASTQEPWTYTEGTATGSKFDALIKTSLSEKFSIDSRYTYQKSDQGTGESTSNIANAKTHTASLKGIWNPTNAWTFSLSSAYSRTSNFILSSVTYTFTPGCGFIYRLGEKLRVDFDYTHAQSYAGAETVKDNYSLRTKYALSDFVDVTLRADQENSVAPDYRLTDITGNVEISL